MTDKTTFPFWYKDWLDSPKIYSDILDSWWSNVSASSPETTQNLYQKMMNQGKTYYFLSEQFSQLLQGISSILNRIVSKASTPTLLKVWMYSFAVL